jgi:hypothetical protein
MFSDVFSASSMLCMALFVVATLLVLGKDDPLDLSY